MTAMGVWEAVLAGGGRRFLKRKDSDAGETGSYSYRIVSYRRSPDQFYFSPNSCAFVGFFVEIPPFARF